MDKVVTYTSKLTSSTFGIFSPLEMLPPKAQILKAILVSLSPSGFCGSSKEVQSLFSNKKMGSVCAYASSGNGFLRTHRRFCWLITGIIHKCRSIRCSFSGRKMHRQTLGHLLGKKSLNWMISLSHQAALCMLTNLEEMSVKAFGVLTFEYGKHLPSQCMKLDFLVWL